LLTLRPEEASHLYETGAVTVVVDKIDLIIPELGFLLGQLSRELGTPTVYQCNLYCSPTGAGSVRHFDQQEVFFVQLSGRKQWRVSPNDQVAYPTGYYFGDHLVHPEVAAICSEFKSATADVRDYVLERGSVMFLPRGYWHESRTIEDSIALTLSIASLSWLDLYSSQIRKKLLQIEAWREPAVGLLGAEARRRVAAGKFRNLLDDLSVRLKSMDVRDFEPETEHTGLGRLQRSRYRTAPGFRLSSSRSGSRFLHAQGHRPIEVNDDIAQVIESMSSADEPFSALDIRILSPGVEIAGILVALERLLEAGFIDAT
jgi:50S ribosomal protein L16 3-hydroxylase